MTGFVQSLITILLFIVILGGLVIIHELGHFITARAAKVKVLEFGIGFPPRAKVLADKGETMYTLNWLPIGGFVKLEGEDGSDADDPRSFASQRYITKMLILVAGVVMNVLLAFVIFTGIALVGDPTIGFKVGSVQDGSPAGHGRHRGRRHRRQHRRHVLRRLRRDLARWSRLRDRPGQQVPSGSSTPTARTPRSRRPSARPARSTTRTAPSGSATTGGTTTSTSLHYSFVEAVQIGVQRTVDALGLIVNGLGQLASSIVNHPTEAPPVAGPVGIATQIGDVFWQLGPMVTLYVAGILSANLAVVNILPFPPLDGGRMLIITLKRLFGARISMRAEQMTYVVGFVFLFAFLIWITGFDIVRGPRRP